MRSSPAALPARLATLAAFALVALNACESTPPPPQRTDMTLTGELMRAAISKHADGRLRVEIEAWAPGAGPTTDRAEPIRLASIDDVRLVLADTAGDRMDPVSLPFVHGAVRDGALVMRCEPTLDHAVVVTFRAAGADRLRVDVVDRVALRSNVLELTVDYRFEITAPFDETEAPHLHDGPDELVGDIAFHAPIAFARKGRASLGLVVDTRSLLDDRRIPQGLELRPDQRLLRHGLIRYRLREDPSGGTRCTRVGALPVRIRNETVRFSHTLVTSAQATSPTTRGALNAEFWRDLDAAQGSGGSRVGPLGDRTIHDHIHSVIDALSEEGWRDVGGEGESLRAAWVGGPVDDLDGTPTRTRFGVKHQALRTAYAIAKSRELRGLEPDPHVMGLVNLVLAAPRRGGMIPSLFEHSAGGSSRWSPEGDRAALGHERGDLENEYFHAFNATCTGYWLLLLSDLLPSRSASILSATGDLARFLIQSQRASGSIPSFYEADELLPLRALFDDDSTECGASALFLAEYSRRTGDSGALRAAERAVSFLGQRDRKLPWSDFETLNHAGPRARPADGVDGTLGLLFAARAAFEVATLSGATSIRDFGEDLCDELATRQHAWAPNWTAGANRRVHDTVDGAIRATNRDFLLGDPRTALAADAFLRGYNATGRRDLLQRGIRALRGALVRTDGGSTPTHMLAEQSDWGRSTAAAIALSREHTETVQAVVNLAGKFAEGIDAVWFEDLEITPGKATFRLLTHLATPQPVIVQFHGMPRRSPPIEVSVNGSPGVEYPADRLRFGIELQPTCVARLEFNPAKTLRSSAPWTPSIRFRGDLPLGTKAHVEYVAHDADAAPAVIPLEGGVDDTMPAQRPDVMAFKIGTVIEAQAFIETPDGRVERLPRDGHPHRIVIGDMNCIDVGDGVEIELEDPGASTIERFIDGREFARVLQADDFASYRLRVPRTATEVHVRLVLSGAARVTSGSQLLYADEIRVEPKPRSIDIQIADPRLWREEGRLALQIQAVAGGEVQLAQILHRTEGRSTPLGTGGETEVALRDIDARLRVWIVPVALSDARIRTSTTELERVFFGGNDYRRTPAPEPRNTSGSVATLLAAVSGGLSELRGKALSTLELDLTTEAIRNATEEVVAELSSALERHLAQMVRGDAVIVICPCELQPVLATDAVSIESATDGESIPIIMLAERSPDGSILASGTVLSKLLSRLYQFDDLGLPETGNFGEFRLPRTDAGHTPHSPSGPNLRLPGWADVVRVSPERIRGRAQEILVGVAPLRSGRTILRLPSDEIRDRGDLFVETHERSSAEPWQPTSGALVYWSFENPGAAPIMRTADGRAARARRLRLSPSRPTWRTPFEPANAADLFRASARLDGQSTPSIATMRGEVLWAIRRMRTERTDGAVRLWLDYLPIDILEYTQQPIWSSGSRAGYGPLSSATGSVQPLESTAPSSTRAIRIETRQAGDGTSVRGRFDLPMEVTPRRVFGRVDQVVCHGAAGARLRVSTGQTLHIDAPLPEGGVQFEFDLPPSAEPNVTVEVIQLGDGPVQCRLAHLVVTPRTSADFPARFPESARSVRLCDDTTYGRTSVVVLGSDGVGRVSSPVIIPQRAAALHLVLGLSAGEDAKVTAKAKLGSTKWHTIVDDVDLTRHGTRRTPLSVVLAEIPEQLASGVHFLDMEFRGDPGIRVHIVSVGVEQH